MDANYLSLFPEKFKELELKEQERKEKIKYGLRDLCNALFNDYKVETNRICRILISTGVDVEDNNNKLDNIDNKYFYIDTGTKYHKVMQNDDVKVHCFIDIGTGEVYRPKTNTTPYKEKTFDLDYCVKYCDWKGNYLK